MSFSQAAHGSHGLLLRSLEDEQAKELIHSLAFNFNSNQKLTSFLLVVIAAAHVTPQGTKVLALRFVTEGWRTLYAYGAILYIGCKQRT